MDVLTITFVTACSAFVSAVAGPLVSVAVASRQIRASVISSNRERWLEALRDSVAEYEALVLSAALLRRALRKDAFDVLKDDPQLERVVERMALARHRILLMLNPAKATHHELSAALEETDRLLLGDEAALERMGERVEALTAAARLVLQVEWARVKRGD